MRYRDLVYGQFEISEPVILEIINSPAMQRLKGINQYGYEPLLAKPKIKLAAHEQNRYTHSLGVYLLLKKFNAPLSEQVAGLIHDISHSAFSHCVEFALEGVDEKKQKHQDNIHDDFIRRTAIPKILEKHGYNLSYILNDKNFPLKEKDLPDLCADRIDYMLRDAIIFREISAIGARKILNNLSVENGNWIFNGYASAEKFSRLFFKTNKAHYSGQKTAVMFAAVGDFLKHALRKKYISQSDLYTTDKIVIKKINQHLKQDKRLNLLWQRMNGKIKVKQTRKNYDARIYCKSRIVDPLYMDKDKIKRLSQGLPGWAKIVKRELKPKEYFLKFEK